MSSHSARLMWWAMAFLSLFTTTFYTSSLTSQLSASAPFTCVCKQPLTRANESKELPLARAGANVSFARDFLTPPAPLTTTPTPIPIRRPINSLSDIQTGQIPFCTQANSSAQAFITNPANSVAIRRMAVHMAVAPTLDACMVKLLDDADPVRAVMAEAPILTFLSSAPPYCGPVVVGTLVAQGYYSFPVQRGHPLAAPLADAVLSNMESLVTNDIVGRYTRSGGDCSGGGGAMDSGAPPAIGVEDFGGVFLATLFIVATAWVLLACEVAVWRRRERPGRVQRACFKLCGGHDFKEAYEVEDEAAEAGYANSAKQRRGANVIEGAPSGDRAAQREAAEFSAANPLNW